MMNGPRPSCTRWLLLAFAALFTVLAVLFPPHRVQNAHARHPHASRLLLARTVRPRRRHVMRCARPLHWRYRTVRTIRSSFHFRRWRWQRRLNPHCTAALPPPRGRSMACQAVHFLYMLRMNRTARAAAVTASSAMPTVALCDVQRRVANKTPYVNFGTEYGANTDDISDEDDLDEFERAVYAGDPSSTGAVPLLSSRATGRPPTLLNRMMQLHDATPATRTPPPPPGVNPVVHRRWLRRWRRTAAKRLYVAGWLEGGGPAPHDRCVRSVESADAPPLQVSAANRHGRRNRRNRRRRRNQRGAVEVCESTAQVFATGSSGLPTTTLPDANTGVASAAIATAAIAASSAILHLYSPPISSSTNISCESGAIVVTLGDEVGLTASVGSSSSSDDCAGFGVVGRQQPPPPPPPPPPQRLLHCLPQSNDLCVAAVATTTDDCHHRWQSALVAVTATASWR